MPVQPPKLCGDITGAQQGDSVQWPNPGSNCTVSQSGTNPFPFCSIPPSSNNSININPSVPPVPQVIICVGPGTYQFVISCCSNDNAVHTVTVE
jgi:hypothetical protein